jgi:uncharacterized HAD superfamily protein
MKNKIHVGYDLDGTLANFIRGWTGQAGRMFQDIEPIINDQELDEYDLHKKYGGKKANAVWQSIQRKSFFYETLPARKEAVEDTRRLIQHDNVEPHYVTARQQETIKNYFGQLNRHQERREKDKITRQTKQWISDQGLYGQVHMQRDKGRAARRLGLDFYIDNRVEPVLDVQRKSSTRAYLLDKEYNRGANVRQRVPDVKTFNDEVRGLVSKL